MKVYSEKPNICQQSKEREFSMQHKLNEKQIPALITSLEEEDTSQTPSMLTQKAT